MSERKRRYEGQSADIEQSILWFLGADKWVAFGPLGQETKQQIKEMPKVAATDEVVCWLNRKLGYRISTRHVQRLLKKLRERGFVEGAGKQGKQDLHKLTQKGWEARRLINEMSEAVSKLSKLKGPANVQISFGPKENGFPKWVSVHAFLFNPRIVRLFEKEIIEYPDEKKRLMGRVILNGSSPASAELGYLISWVVYYYLRSKHIPFDNETIKKALELIEKSPLFS